MSLTATLFIQLINALRGFPLSQCCGTLSYLPLLTFLGYRLNAIPKMPGVRRTKKLQRAGVLPYSLCYFTIF